MRWIWIDRFLEFKSGSCAKAIKCSSMAEDHFADHFPGYPILPATLILEGLAQTGGILVGEANQFQEKVVLAKFPSVRFHREVLAWEELTYEAQITSLRPEAASVDGKATVGEELIAEVSIFFAHLDQNRSQQIFGEENFVFSGELSRMRGLLKEVMDKEETDSG